MGGVSGRLEWHFSLMCFLESRGGGGGKEEWVRGVPPLWTGLM